MLVRVRRVRGIKRLIINLCLFICVFLTSFAKNEVTTIEALPKKERATLDIEVLKVKTEKITGVINENEKKIIFDFKDLKEAAAKKRIFIDNSSYEVFILENLNNADTYMKKNEQFKMNRFFQQGVKLRNGEKIELKNISYALVDRGMEKVLEVTYEKKPETFYLGISNNKTGMVEKIYRAEFREDDFYDDYDSDSKLPLEYIIKASEIENYKKAYWIVDFGEISVWSKELKRKNVPAIGVGDFDHWKYEGNQSNPTTEAYPKVRFNIGTNIESDIYIGHFNQAFKKVIDPKKYEGKDYEGNRNQEEAITIGDFGNLRNRVTGNIKIAIANKTLKEMLEYAKKRDDQTKVEIPYADESYKISLIAGEKEGRKFEIPDDGDYDDEKISEVDYPKIYIEKDDIKREGTLTLEFEDGYIEEDRVDFDIDGKSNHPKVISTINSGDFLDGFPGFKGKLVVKGTNINETKDFEYNGEVNAHIKTSSIDMNIIYDSNGKFSIRLNGWTKNEYNFEIKHIDNGVERASYELIIKTRDPSFIIKDENYVLDFGTVLKDSINDTASVNILAKNSYGKIVVIKPDLIDGKVELKNDKKDSIIIAQIDDIVITPSSRKKSNESNYSEYPLKGTLIDKSQAKEGQHTGQFYLTVELRDEE